MDETVAINVLLVDDEDGAVPACDWLSRAVPGEFSVTRARRLSECLSAIEGDSADVVLLNLTLPDSRGLDTAHAVLARAAHRPVVILTDAGEERLAASAVDMGAQDYLIKGRTSSGMVARTIRNSLGRKRIEGELSRRNAQLLVMASTDSLTGLHNARHLREALPEACAMAAHRKVPISVVMLDIDQFKGYNDTFGHPAGDEVLRRVGAILRATSRPCDVAARSGGEEFVVILPDAGEDDGLAFAERLKAAFLTHPWPLRRVTASFGVATDRCEARGGDALISEADRALYRAKWCGRDRIVHGRELAPIAPPDAAPSRVGAKTEPAGAEDAPRGRILHIDDQPDYRCIVARALAKADLQAVGASTAAEGLRLAATGVDVILLDVRLPDLDGIEACRRLKADPATRAIPVVLLSASLEFGTDRELALALGADVAMSKLARINELICIINRLVYAASLTGHQGGEESIRGWMRALEVRDPEEAAHGRRVAGMAVRVGGRLGMSVAELEDVRRGALLHDIGKLGIPDAILRKPGPLSERERAVMQLHPELAAAMLGPDESMRTSLAIPMCHHERWDGGGYPRGLAGEAIPRAARIFAAVDIWDALTHDRPYRDAWPARKARGHLDSLTGSHLDPAAVRAMLEEVG